MFIEQNCLKHAVLHPTSHWKALLPFYLIFRILANYFKTYSAGDLISVPSINSIYTNNIAYLLSTYYVSSTIVSALYIHMTSLMG